jgi:FkbM family methyltransferase
VPVSLGRFGTVDSWAEATNLIDNFALGELRSSLVEQHLANAQNPCVVDVGVNVGVTCRWWLSLNPTLKVIGIDMFQEALDFTARKIESQGDGARWQSICAAVGAREQTIDVRYDDPLEGTSSVISASGKRSRSVPMQTLDRILHGVAPPDIDLLKIDIEGSAGDALGDAAVTLERCHYVVVETHTDSETRRAASALHKSGLQLFRCHGRTMWWGRDKATR